MDIVQCTTIFKFSQFPQFLIKPFITLHFHGIHMLLPEKNIMRYFSVKNNQLLEDTFDFLCFFSFTYGGQILEDPELRRVYYTTNTEGMIKQQINSSKIVLIKKQSFWSIIFWLSACIFSVLLYMKILYSDQLILICIVQKVIFKFSYVLKLKLVLDNKIYLKLLSYFKVVVRTR